MLSSLNCPNCQASLNYQTEEHHATIHCDYCNSTIVLPETLRGNQNVSQTDSLEELWEVVSHLALSGKKIEAIKTLRDELELDLASAKEIVEAISGDEAVYLGGNGVRVTTMGEAVTLSPADSRRVTRWIGCLVVAIVLVTLLGVLIPTVGTSVAVWLGLKSAAEDGSGNISDIIDSVSATATVAPSPTPAFANVVLTVGQGEGTGPGFLMIRAGLARIMPAISTRLIIVMGVYNILIVQVNLYRCGMLAT